MSYAVEGLGIEKSFVRKRSLGQLLRDPFGRAERVHALRGVDLQVAAGEIYGLLGPNGAGKTTLLKILSCLVLPDKGLARIRGVDTADENRVKPQLGLVTTDERSFYWRLSGRENMRFFSILYDVPSDRRMARIDELLERVGLTEAADQRFSDYSAGMKQRLSIARSLLHDPPVLLMDEPTRSLDPAASLELRAFVKDQLKARDKKTIILATHNLPEAEALCDRLAILIKGRIRQEGSVDAVRAFGLDTHGFELELDRWPGDFSGPARVHKTDALPDGVLVQLSLTDGAELGDLLAALISAGVTIRRCDRHESDLEEAFTRILDAETPAESGQSGEAAS